MTTKVHHILFCFSFGNLVYHCGSDEYGWSPIFWFTAMRNDSDFVVRMALYGDMGTVNAQSLPRLQEETQQGHFDLILHVGQCFDVELIDSSLIFLAR